MPLPRAGTAGRVWRATDDKDSGMNDNTGSRHGTLAAGDTASAGVAAGGRLGAGVRP
jgi:hypothetical protein